MLNSPLSRELVRAFAEGTTAHSTLFSLKSDQRVSTVSLSEVMSNDALGLPATASIDTRRGALRYVLTAQIKEDLLSSDPQVVEVATLANDRLQANMSNGLTQFNDSLSPAAATEHSRHALSYRDPANLAFNSSEIQIRIAQDAGKVSWLEPTQYTNEEGTSLTKRQVLAEIAKQPEAQADFYNRPGYFNIKWILAQLEQRGITADRPATQAQLALLVERGLVTSPEGNPTFREIETLVTEIFNRTGVTTDDRSLNSLPEELRRWVTTRNKNGQMEVRIRNTQLAEHFGIKEHVVRWIVFKVRKRYG